MGAKRILALGSVAALCVGAAAPLFMASAAGAATVTGVCVVSPANQTVVAVDFSGGGLCALIDVDPAPGLQPSTYEPITGPAGAQGPTGASPQGPTGPTGLAGNPGNPGAKGPNGASPKGATGNPGTTGVTGPTGAQGPTGAVGPSPTGPQGALGATGTTGAIGPQGAPGPAGAKGATGAAGSDAVNQAIPAFTVNGTGQSVSTTSPGATTNLDLTPNCPVFPGPTPSFLVGGSVTLSFSGGASEANAAIVSSYPFPAGNLQGTGPSNKQWVGQAVVIKALPGGTVTATAHAYCRP